MQLVLNIGPYNQRIITSDGLEMEVKYVYVDVDGDFLNLQDYKPTEPILDLKLLLLGQHTEQIILPKKLKEVMITFLNFIYLYQREQDMHFSCYSMAKMVYDISQEESQPIDDVWVLKPQSASNITIGDVVFFLGKNKHVAINIRPDLYISIYGGGGDLEVSTYKQITEGYETDTVLVATPRK